MTLKTVVSLLAIFASVVTSNSDILLDAGGGLSWRLVPSSTNTSLYALGQPLLHNSPLDSPNLILDDGIAFWRRSSDYLVVKVLASSVTLDNDGSGATLSGSVILPNASSTGEDADASVSIHVWLDSQAPAASIGVAFSSISGIKSSEWQLCVKWAHDGETMDEWRLQGYPLAGNSTVIPSTTKLEYFGWPGFLLVRPNSSTVAYFGVSTLDDYQNPNTWTGQTMFGYQASSANNGYQISPQFLFGFGGLGPGQVCETTLRLIASSAGETIVAVQEIVPQLMRLDSYSVEPMPQIRSESDMLACFLNARRITPMWRNTPNGNAYQLQDIANFIYLGTTPESAYFEYRIFMSTGDAFWRNRTFEQMLFWLQGQNVDESSRHYGAVNTVYELPSGPFDSTDRGNNVGWKIDLNAHMARYVLLLVELISTNEPGVDVSAWKKAGEIEAQWIVRMGQAQAGNGVAGSAGFPQIIFKSTDKPSPSVVSGRLLNALPVFRRVLGDSATYNYSQVFENAREWHVNNIERDLYYTGQHPDLIYYDYDQDAIWEVVEMWLDVSDDPSSSPQLASYALSRAVGNALVAFLMLCPKQLSWVTNPTQMAADEQEFYSQYSVYTYHNRKWLSLVRLGNSTAGKSFPFMQLADRLMQLNAFTQVTSNGNPSDTGGFHECIADPWNARGGGPNFIGSVYLNELALDLVLQIHLSGINPTPGYTECTKAI